MIKKKKRERERKETDRQTPQLFLKVKCYQRLKEKSFFFLMKRKTKRKKREACVLLCVFLCAL